MAFARRDIRGGAVQTTIVGDITSGSASCSLTATTGWPDGSTNGSFYVVIDPGTASEEKILCTTRSSGTLNFGTRGADGTTAAAHAAGAVIYPIGAATDFDEANLAVSETIGKVTTAGDMLVASGANAFQRLAKGSNSTVLNVSSGGSVGWGTVTSAMIADGTIATGDIADSQVTNAKLAGMTRGTIKVGNASGVASDLAIGASGYVLTSDGTDAAWGASSVADGAISTAKLAADAATKAKIDPTARYKEVLFSKSGTLSTTTGTHRWYTPTAVTLVDAWASVGTAPTGQSLIVDVNHNGTTIFTTQGNRPTITASGNYDLSGTADGDVTIAAGEYLTVDIDQVGSGTAGSDLTVAVRYYEDD